MNKSKLEQRREYVKEQINSAPNTTQAVKELSDKLFLSEKTIWNDLKG